MKKFKVQFEFEEGYDEFWESNPSLKEVYADLVQELTSTYLDIDKKSVTIIECHGACNYGHGDFLHDSQSDKDEETETDTK